jgi:hypothetical protein
MQKARLPQAFFSLKYEPPHAASGPAIAERDMGKYLVQSVPFFRQPTPLWPSRGCNVAGIGETIDAITRYSTIYKSKETAVDIAALEQQFFWGSACKGHGQTAR